MSLYQEVEHPHISARRLRGPVRVIDQYAAVSRGRFGRIDMWLAVKITAIVGTMICA